MTTRIPPLDAPIAGRCRVAWPVALAALAALLSAPGCRSGMYDQPKYQPLEESSFFEDGQASRPVILETVARGHLDEDDAFSTGIVGGEFVAANPLTVDEPLLERGRQRYNIYCTPCHGETGDGDGMIVRRGMPRPPTYHLPRLKEAGDGYFFDVITNGHGIMYSYASRVEPRDRWAIVAYIRALQLSQDGSTADLPAAEKTAQVSGEAAR